MKKEKGQALPLAIIALTIGVLLIVPFLGHASSSMIGSRTYGSVIDYRTACDAGVEHAIWGLQYNNLSFQIPNPGDQITYQLGEAINGITPTVTVTTNSLGHGTEITGNITGIIDTYKYRPSVTYEANIIKVANTIYAVVTRTSSDKGVIQTFVIDTNGIITKSIISSYQFDSTCFTPVIIHISGTVYAIAYRGSSYGGYLKTINIASNGIIAQSVISSMTFDTSSGYEPSIIPVSGNVYAVAYRGSSNKGYVKTVTIAANGIIGSSAISTLIFNSSTTYEPLLIKTSGNFYAIAYRDASNRGTLKTINIAENGVIDSSPISSLVFDNSHTATPDIIKISDTVYAIYYTGVSNYGYLKTISIGTNGIISQTIIATINYETVMYSTHILQVAPKIYMTCGRSNNNDGLLRMVKIDDNGTILNGNICSFTYIANNGFDPQLVQVFFNVFAICYRDTGNSGYVTTIELSTIGSETYYTIVASAGITSIRAYVSINDDGVITIISWKLE
jgi:hypothetical protein